MEQSDGIEEELTRWSTIAVTAAARATETLVRARHVADHERAQRAEVQAQEVARRFVAERETARALYQPFLHDSRWEHARTDQVATVYGTARAWAEVDDDAKQAVRLLRTRIAESCGFDPETVAGADLELALVEAQAAREEKRRDEHQAEAVALLGAAHEADRGSVGEGTLRWEQGALEWDLADRREQRGRELRAKVGDDRAVEAVMLSDTAQATPASEAVTSARRVGARAGRGRTSAPVPRQELSR